MKTLQYMSIASLVVSLQFGCGKPKGSDPNNSGDVTGVSSTSPAAPTSQKKQDAARSNSVKQPEEPRSGPGDLLPGAEGPKLVNLVKSPFNGSLSVSLEASMKTREEWQEAYPLETKELFVHVVSHTIPPPSTKIDVKLRAPPGKTGVAIGNPVTIETPGVGVVTVEMVFPCRASAGPLPEGSYQAEVWIDGVRSLLLNWAIMPGAPRPGKSVRLEEFEISDAKMKELAKVPELRSLYLYNGGSNSGKVSADGWRELAALNQLHTLNVGSLWLDEASFQALASFRSLQTLRIQGRFQLTDKCLTDLAKIKTLRDLSLKSYAPQFTPDGLRKLSALPELEHLEIGELAATVVVDDAGLKELAKIKTLKSLFIPYSPKITDDGLQELAALKELRFLSLRSVEGESRVTRAGIDRLQKLLPMCRIER